MTAEQLRYAARGAGEAEVLVVFTDEFGQQRVARLDTARVVPDYVLAEDYGVSIEGSKAVVLLLEE
jgi:hypothetical protein